MSQFVYKNDLLIGVANGVVADNGMSLIELTPVNKHANPLYYGCFADLECHDMSEFESKHYAGVSGV